MSARLSGWNSSAPTGRIFVKLDNGDLYSNMPRKLSLAEAGQNQQALIRKDLCKVISRRVAAKLSELSEKKL
jgi:hypothetical protein